MLSEVDSSESDASFAAPLRPFIAFFGCRFAGVAAEASESDSLAASAASFSRSA